jgi:hypothetical protein
MCIPDPVRERVAHRVGRRATRRRYAATAFAGAVMSSVGLLGSCIEHGSLFGDYDDHDALRATDGADAGKEDDADVLTPSVPEAPTETPPFDAELTGVGDAVPTSEPSDALPPEVSESPDSGTAAPDVAPVASEACSACLSSECPEAIQTCRATPGCEAISACAQGTDCVDDACYCGTINLFLCATTGQGNGPCRDVALAAPDAHEPTPAVPNAGPAAEAARLVGNCRRASAGCRDVCGG